MLFGNEQDERKKKILLHIEWYLLMKAEKKLQKKNNWEKLPTMNKKYFSTILWR